MMKGTPVYKRTIFWENVKKTLAVFSGPTVYTLHELSVSDGWMLIAGMVGMVGALLAVWMTDNNNNGVVDLFDEDNGTSN